MHSLPSKAHNANTVNGCATPFTLYPLAHGSPTQVPVCPLGTVNVDGECTQCNANCNTCLSPQRCTTCVVDYLLSNGSCGEIHRLLWHACTMITQSPNAAYSITTHTHAATNEWPLRLSLFLQ